MLRVATKYDLPVYRAIGSFWLGATQAMHGDLTGGLRQMEPTFEPLDGIGLFVLLPAVVMVDTLARAGRDRDALALIARVLGKISSASTSSPRRPATSSGFMSMSSARRRRRTAARLRTAS